MNKVKAVSFDFWNTLVIPNPKYAEARTEYLHSNYGLEKEDYTKVKQHLDHYAETNGLAVTPEIAISMLFPYPNYSNVDLSRVLCDFLAMFKENPPFVPEEVVESISILTGNKIPWGITSNTNFIPGEVLDAFLCYNSSGVDLTNYCYTSSGVDLTYCYSKVFSDKFGYSKPSSVIFGKTAQNLYEVSTSRLSFENILHIGDNKICDYDGAINAGMQAKLIKTPKDILDTVRTL